MKRHAETIHRLLVNQMRRSAFILSLITCTLIISAQQPVWDMEECSARIINAEAAYQEGNLIDCIKTLKNALDSCDFSRKDKEWALEILAKAYVETGDQDNADSTINILLSNYPHFELKEAEGPEMFNRLVKRYRIHPLFTLGVKNTANWLRHKTTEVYSVLDGLDYSQPLVESGYWFTYYGVAEYEFIDGLSINGDMMFFWSNLSRNFFKEPGFELNYWEKNFYIELPLYLKKYFDIRKSFFAYVSAGAGPFFTYKALGNVTLKYTAADVITGKNADFEGGLYDINILPLKNKAIPQWNAGFGVGYKIKNFRFVLDARYLSLLGSINAPENSDAIPELKNDYFYIDQGMKINQFEAGATISYTLFNSVKRIHKK